MTAKAISADAPATQRVGRVARRHRILAGTAVVTTALALASFIPFSAEHVANVAWVDESATSRLVSEIRTTADALFTVTPDTVKKARAAAQANLVGAAPAQYRKLYGATLKRAAQGASLGTLIRSIGVTRLSGTSARLLVLADQTAAVGGQSRSGAAQLTLDAVQDGGRWRISSITVL